MEQTLPNWANTISSLGQTATNLFTAIKGGTVPESAESKAAAQATKRANAMPYIIGGGVLLAVLAFVLLRRK